MTLEGYDISHHQATTPDLTGIDFVICRATFGTNPDDMYQAHVAAVRAAGKIVGAYHFARPVSTGQTVEAQVEAFLKAAPDADFWVVDREQDSTVGATITAADTRKFISLVRATGRRIGLYASESAFRDFGQDWNWVANWSREPAIAYDIWQWEGGGTDKLDNDRFRGTRGALLALGAPLEAWVNALAVRAANAEVEVARLTAELEAARNRIAILEATLEEATGKIGGLELELHHAETKISSATLLLENGTEVRAHAILTGETA